MTNNQTINGLDREILAFALGFKCHGYKNRTDQQADKQNALDKIRALLDAPAVERQESVVFPRDLTDEMSEAIALRANCCGGIAYDIWEGLVHCIEKPKHPDIEVCGSWPVQSELPPRVSELQSTIARLEARVAELESARGEIIHQVRTHGSDCWEDISGESLELCQCDPEEYEIRKLFTAPPAPPAVVLPERMTGPRKDYGYTRFAEGWNACLDATAALNGPAK